MLFILISSSSIYLCKLSNRADASNKKKTLYLANYKRETKRLIHRDFVGSTGLPIGPQERWWAATQSDIARKEIRPTSDSGELTRQKKKDEDPGRKKPKNHICNDKTTMEKEEKYYIQQQ